MDTKTPKIVVVIKNDTFKEASEEYWKFDGYKFSTKVPELMKKYGKNALKDIKKSSYAYFEGYHQCIDCRSKIEFTNRSPIGDAVFNKGLKCTNCSKYHSFIQGYSRKYKVIEIERVEDKESETKDIVVSPTFEKFTKMEEAFFSEKYTLLKPVEYNFLVHYCITKNIKSASLRIGISEEIGEKFFYKLCDMNLVCSFSSFVLPELVRLLVSEGLDAKTRNIFGVGLKLKELFLFLKRDNIYVFPKIPISQFLVKEYAEKYFDKKSHSLFFVNTMVDFLVVDLNGMPKFAVDYLSTSHDNPEKLDRLMFRKNILTECGVPHYCVNGTDLNRMNSSLVDYKFPDDLINP